MKLIEIQMMPTVIDKTHESCYQSYHILIYVLEMVKRGDSAETIFDLVEMLRDTNSVPGQELKIG
jgi:hypothetical protein